MGYYVQLDEANLLVRESKWEAAFTALCDLNTNPAFDHKKTGGSYSGGRQTAKWFAWMPENYHETCKTVQEILNELGFELSETELADGEKAFSIDYYDSKSGSEDLFIEHLAPFAEPGWYLIWRGEDGSQWKVDAEGYHNGTVVFD